MRIALFVACAAALLWVAVPLLRRDSVAPTPPLPAPGVEPASTPQIADSDAAAIPAGRTDARAFIPCPDGSRLPSLNGVLDPPAIQRAPEHGPLPPVIATRRDAAGNEWYEHADGSMTTTRMQAVFDARGRAAVQAITIHTTDLPADGSIRAMPHAPRPSPTQPEVR